MRGAVRGMLSVDLFMVRHWYHTPVIGFSWRTRDDHTTLLGRESQRQVTMREVFRDFRGPPFVLLVKAWRCLPGGVGPTAGTYIRSLFVSLACGGTFHSFFFVEFEGGGPFSNSVVRESLQFQPDLKSLETRLGANTYRHDIIPS